MAISAVVGYAQGLDAREVGSQAALSAFSKANRRSITLGFLIASDNLDFAQVVSGVTAILGDAPVLGLSTSLGLTSSGVHQSSVIVALLLGGDLLIDAGWWSDFGIDSQSSSQKMVSHFKTAFQDSSIMVVADGLHGDVQDFCNALPAGNYTLAGCLAGGDLRQTRTFQVGGQDFGQGGLAAVSFNERLKLGVGLGNGWQDVGAYFTVTRVRGPWIQTLNDLPIADVFSNWLGYEPHDWTIPPLDRLIRLYPFGIESGLEMPLLIRSPLRIETDGSLRMHTQVAVGSVVHLMAGTIESCLQSARQAVELALQSLGKARPILALVFPDIAWQILLETKPGAEINTIRKIIGESTPIAGGYVLGHISRLNNHAQFHNQQIQVILIAEASG